MRRPAHRAVLAVAAAALLAGVFLGARWGPPRLDSADAISGARRLERVQPGGERWEALLASGFDPARRDFDGDGVPDTIDHGWYRMGLLIWDSYAGRLRVISGGDGRVLLDATTAVPSQRYYWCEDQDGDGADELLAEDGSVAVLLAHAR